MLQIISMKNSNSLKLLVLSNFLLLFLSLFSLHADGNSARPIAQEATKVVAVMLCSKRNSWLPLTCYPGNKLDLAKLRSLGTSPKFNFKRQQLNQLKSAKSIKPRKLANTLSSNSVPVCNSGPHEKLEGAFLSLLHQFDLVFHHHDRPIIHKENELDFQVDLNKLRQGTSQYSIGLHSPQELSKEGFFPIDHTPYQQHQNSVVLTTKLATIIKDKQSEQFSRDFFTSDEFLKIFISEFKVHEGEDLHQKKVEIDLNQGPFSFGKINFKLSHREHASDLSPASANLEKVEERHRKILYADQNLQKLPRLIVSEAKDASFLLNHVELYSKVYTLRGSDQSEHTLLVFYAQASLKTSDLKLPIWMIRGPLTYGMSEQVAYLVNSLRQ
jgi:hypothetical protein